ncbi:protein HEADING DATE REPRESSOR 1-like [Salvia splendens]|uniref:protein HEADING DATE REPRESSOR 1-like n=1 Tax=Salvia splendens TaxID=180675 RepID=UPI001C267DC2|nr:protein HEADING DATE REPRESSOR 1-like [Salvia splendens]
MDSLRFLLLRFFGNLGKDLLCEEHERGGRWLVSSAEEKHQEPNSLSEKRKALFEPLEPVINTNGKRPSAETLLPPPDFESASYPKGWLIAKNRKLVNVDVVESMRRIAVQEMNRKDNEQLEEGARCLEHQLLDERSKRADVERQNTMLQSQITMLMEMLQENKAVEDEGTYIFINFSIFSI